eukprot:CAMPEP_0194030682 /NCGR_PEP_ID=MMETSP0009_2-20130614/4065_1 /TAXON_ID=210454 /ORGANISM="Grammatophora oceanica, Strain CCMP 410" /LENGTH=230 /DNA_ID=CAMNT_0038670663 /DNA_START=13 /DNA_END=705 /DNA_ORIENTATION=-
MTTKKSSAVSSLLAIFCLLLATAQRGVYADDDDKPVTCGSAVKFTHVESATSTNVPHYLHSEEKQLGGGGSGQQIVTWMNDKASRGSLWWIRGANDLEQECPPGQPLKCGDTIRLTHLETKKNLHTHAFSSPLSKQQEITAFGQGDGRGDGGDDWIVECTNKNQMWTRGSKFRLLHRDTQKYLGASSNVKFTQQNCGHSCPILNHLEAFGRRQVDSFGELKVELGIHLSQ